MTKNGEIPKEHPNPERRFSQEQYEMLLRCLERTFNQSGKAVGG